MQENFGEIFTKRWVAETLLDLVGYQSTDRLIDRTLIEPSVGGGSFLIPALERLLASLEGNIDALLSAPNALRAYDLVEANVETSKRLVAATLVKSGMRENSAKALAETWIRHGDFLLETDIPRAHFVVGNPPYIRIEDLPKGLSDEYRSRWQTMRGRADIFVGFFERGLSLLEPECRLGYICADRWMRNQYGAGLRELVSTRYAMEDIWLIHDVDAFDSEVSAYPAITVISNREQGGVVVADAGQEFNRDEAVSLMSWGRNQHGPVEAYENAAVSAHNLDHWFTGKAPWPNGNASQLALISELERNYPTLESEATGTKVSIGVATGADKAYIVKSAEVESSRLLPLSMVGDLKANGEFVWGGNYLVNPWSEDGELISLDSYPLTQAYFEGHESIRKRYVATKQPDTWYRTIDKVTHAIVNRPKLLIQDMRAEINPVFEPGGHYPHHNLYYVTSAQWDLEVLGGLLMSDHAQILLGAYAIRMRGGTIRFQSQYLRLIRVPNLDSISQQTADALRQAFRSRDRGRATSAAEVAYDIRLSEYGLV